MDQFQEILDRLEGRIDTPVPIVLADVMQRNIERTQAMASARGIAVRPHVKTHKCIEIGRRQVDAGAIGITAGNVGEAEVFAAAGFEDIFLAYPVWPSGTKGERIRRLTETTRLRIGVDNPAAVDALAAAMGEEPERLEVVVEIDCGARRSGAPPELAGDLARQARARGLRPVGVFTYPGHGWAGREARVRATQDQQLALGIAVGSVEDVGVRAEVVSAGSTPTFAFATGGLITELRPGEYVFGDMDNSRIGACTTDDIALFLAATVVSNWVPDQVILDVGTKAMGREGNAEKGYGALAGSRAALARLNEYHGYVALPEGEAKPRLGSVVPVVPNHVCPVVASFEELLITDSQGATLDQWEVAARGRLS